MNFMDDGLVVYYYEMREHRNRCKSHANSLPSKSYFAVIVFSEFKLLRKGRYIGNNRHEPAKETQAEGKLRRSGKLSGAEYIAPKPCATKISLLTELIAIIKRMPSPNGPPLMRLSSFYAGGEFHRWRTQMYHFYVKNLEPLNQF